MNFLNNLKQKSFLKRNEKSVIEFIELAKAFDFNLTNGDKREKFFKFIEFRKELFLKENNFNLKILLLVSDLSSHYLGYLIGETVNGTFGSFLNKKNNLIIIDTNLDLQLNLFELLYFYYKGDYSLERIKSILILLDMISNGKVTKNNIEEYIKNNIAS